MGDRGRSEIEREGDRGDGMGDKGRSEIEGEGERGWNGR